MEKNISGIDPTELEKANEQHLNNFAIDPSVMERLRKIVLTGPYLDKLASHYGLERKSRRFLWIFKIKETDACLLKRLMDSVKVK